MNDLQKMKLDDICYRSTKGHRLTPEENEFVQDMYHRFAEEYREVQVPASIRAHNEVNPFI